MRRTEESGYKSMLKIVFIARLVILKTCRRISIGFLLKVVVGPPIMECRCLYIQEVKNPGVSS